MNDQILTDDEKDALLDGVENGEIEVQSGTGPKYATVAAFEVAPRNRIVTNSYPRLQSMNRKLAGVISKSSSLRLNDTVEITPGSLTTSTWAGFCEQADEVALIYEFSARPLDGSAAVWVPGGAVRHIVETFYGGSGKNPPHQGVDTFTAGEINVLSLFCGDILKGIAETWQSVISFELEKGGVHHSTDVVEVIEDGATVICSEFELRLGEERHVFHVVWPASMLTSLLPVLAGAKRERNPHEDARWETVIRRRVAEARVGIQSRIGNARMNLRAIATLIPGDIIDLQNPREARILVNHVPVIEGRFGVHDGRYAIEANCWLAGTAPREAASDQS